MYNFLQISHILLAVIVLLLLTAVVINSVIGYTSKKEFGTGDRKIALFGLIFTHLQLVVGLIFYFVSPLGKAVLGEMKNADLRLTSMEHPLINLIAIILITVGWSKHKRLTESVAKFKTISVFYGLGLVFILSRIPWKLLFEFIKGS